MAVESYGRTDDGIAWEVRHRLWSGPWWWVLTMPDGQVRQSPECYETERQALDAVEDARRQALAGLPLVETMSSLRARAEAAEARAIAAEAQAAMARGALLLAEDARAEGEAVGYRRAIDDVCRFLDDEQMLAWSTLCSPHGDWFAKGVQHAMSRVRKLAPAEPSSGTGGPTSGGT